MKKIMKRILFLSIFCFLSLIAFPQAVINFKSLTFDYGNINKGSDGTRVISFKNTGNVPLEITSVKSSCGCISIDNWPKTAIAQGMSGEITITYFTRLIGPINKTISIYANANPNPTILRISGTVFQDAELKSFNDAGTGSSNNSQNEVYRNGVFLYNKADKADYNNEYKEISSLNYSDGKLILVKKININASRINPDNSRYYKTTIGIIIDLGTKVKINEIETNIYSIKESDLAMMPCMLFDPLRNIVTIFASGKNPESSNYGMEGFAYRIDMNNHTWSKETVFDRVNSGWYSFFGGSDNGNPVLWHFSMAGYYAIKSSRNNNGTWSWLNIGSYEPSTAIKEFPYRKNILVTSSNDVDRMSANSNNATSHSPQFTENEVAIGAAVLVGAVLWQGAKWLINNSGGSSSSYSNNSNSSGTNTPQKCYEYIETKPYPYCGITISTHRIRCLNNGTKYDIFYYPGGKGDCLFSYSEGWYKQGTGLSDIGNWYTINIDKNVPYEEAAKKQCGCK
jgi:hypothetical protein